MIHFKLTRKNVRRLCVTMALIAPIIYLFGSLFTGLNGAHGQQIFADGEGTSQKSYDELMEVDNFNYGSFDWTNEHGTRLGFSLGDLSFYAESVGFDSLVRGFPSGVNVVNNFGVSYNYGLGFPDALLDRYIAINFFWDDESVIDEVIFDSDCYFPFYLWNQESVLYAGFGYYDSSTYVSGLVFYNYDDSDWVMLDVIPTLDDSDAWVFYFDDGAHLPDGVSWNDELASYFVPKVKATETQTYSDYVFGQFFARDNFVSKIGEDAISETPHGFAPFGSLFRYIDDTALHMGDTQIGLMAYGYMYWCAHVLLFDVLFMMTTFFIGFIERVGDRIGGNE